MGHLAHELDITASNISQHLRVLKDLGLVREERRGHWIHCFPDEEQLGAYRCAVQEPLGVVFVGGSALEGQAEDE